MHQYATLDLKCFVQNNLITSVMLLAVILKNIFGHFSHCFTGKRRSLGVFFKISPQGSTVKSTFVIQHTSEQSKMWTN